MAIVRSDSRTEVDLRALTMRMSVLSRSDGSAQFSFGDLKALGAVTGPAEVRIRDEKPTEATIEVNVVPVCGLPGPQCKASAHAIKLFFTPLILLKKYPRSLIQINLQTLSKPSNRWISTFSTGSPEQPPVARFDESQSVAEKAALMNAASLALLDSGIAMSGVALAVAVAVIPSSAVQNLHPDDQLSDFDRIVLDPNPAEEACARSLHLVGLHFGHEIGRTSPADDQVGKVAFCESNGAFNYDQLQNVLKYASSAALQLFSFVRQSIELRYRSADNELAVAPSRQSSTTHRSTFVQQEEDTKRKKKKNK